MPLNKKRKKIHSGQGGFFNLSRITMNLCQTKIKMLVPRFKPPGSSNIWPQLLLTHQHVEIKQIISYKQYHKYKNHVYFRNVEIRLFQQFSNDQDIGSGTVTSDVVLGCCYFGY